MKTLVVVTSSHKSWAYGIEQCLRYRKDDELVTLLDLSSINSLGIISPFRRRYQRQICRTYEITQIVIRKHSLIHLKVLVQTLAYLAFFILKRRLVSPPWDNSLSFPLWATRCRLAQTLGAKEFSDSEIPIRYLFRFLKSGLVSLKVLEMCRTLCDFQKVSLFNGRDPADACIIRSSLDNNLKVELTERASDDTKFEIYRVSPHYQPEWWEKAIDFWVRSEKAGQVDEKKITQYLTQKSLGYDSFMGQKWNKYHDDSITYVNPGSKYIVFFATSSHEFSPIDEYNSEMGYASQFEAVIALKTIALELGVTLIIKRHPNSLSPLDGGDREFDFWKNFSSDKCLVIGPRERVNISELVSASRTCFVWRSSVGVETLFLGVPTYALGSARWAWNEEVRAWDPLAIRAAILFPKTPPEEVLRIYGNYMASGGKDLINFKHVNRNFVTTHGGRRLYHYFLGRVWLWCLSLREFALGPRKRKV